MQGSFYCLDNDIILKLSTCNLFDDTFKTFDVEVNQVKILDSFQYKFSSKITRKRGNKANNDYDKYNVEKALKFTRNYATLSESNCDAIDIEIYTRLVNYSKNSNDKKNTIDQGEAILISHICYLNQQGDNSYLLTGDKRCLKALINSGFTDVIEPLEGKVWCLEQLILKNIEAFGFEYVKTNIVPVNICDAVLKVAFSSFLTTEENSIGSLTSYLEELRKDTGNLLHIYPDNYSKFRLNGVHQ